MKRGDAIKNMMEQLGDAGQFMFQIDDDQNLMSMGDLVRIWEYLNAEIKVHTEAVIKAEPQNKEPRKTSIKKKKLDDAKMQALKNAGWSCEKIADEMGVSVPTVYSHLKKVKAEGVL